MSNSDPTPEKAPSLIQVEFPKEITPFVWLAMTVGLVLAVIGVLCLSLSIPASAANVMIGSGIAIVLAAFGGQATITGKAFVFAGVTAIAAAIIWFLFYQQQKQVEIVEKQYVLGTLHGLPKSGHPRLRFTNYVLGSEVLETRDFRFIIFESNTTEAKYAVLGLDDPDNPEATIEISIPKSCLIRSLGSTDALDWKYQKVGSEHQVVEREEGGAGELTIGQWGRDTKNQPLALLPQTTCPLRAAELRRPSQSPLDLAWVFAARAYAQGSDSAPAALTQEKLDGLITDMQSDDTSVRRTARDTLSNAGPTDIPIIMNALKNGIGTYRTKLGIVVALTEMLRRDKSQNEKIWPLLTDEGRNLLLDLAGDSDRTVNIYATEFLFDLGDKRVTELAFARAAGPAAAAARFNWIFAGLDGWRRLNKDEQTQLRPVIATIKKIPGIGPNTLELFDKLP